MKVLAKLFCVGVAAAVVAGCASDSVYVPKVPPHAQAKLLDYYSQPGQKVFVIAVDPSGDFAYGYDYGKVSLEEALAVAVEKCDMSRESQGIIAKPHIYAINDKVVYETSIRRQAELDKK